MVVKYVIYKLLTSQVKIFIIMLFAVCVFMEMFLNYKVTVKNI